jgi:hypothetical protein
MGVIMSQSSLNWDAFVREVVRYQKLWTIRDERGFIAPLNADNVRAMPFWSTRNRAENVIKNAPDYSQFEVYEISLREFRDRWVKGMQADNLHVGVNWSGNRVTGFDIEPGIVLQRLSFEENKFKAT